MPGLQLSFNKVVFPPTSFVAVHTYTAGSFFAVVALRTDTTDNDIHLLGKELFSQLEAEFFSLEEKTLQTIKDVIAAALLQLPDGVVPSLSATYIKDSLAYVFTTGGASVLLKRGEKVGSILHSDDTAKDIATASGRIQADDLLFLQTVDFSRHIPLTTIQQVSDRLSNEIADTLSTRLQTVENSGAASIILKVEGLGITPPSIFVPQQPNALAPLEAPATQLPAAMYQTPDEKATDPMATKKPAQQRKLPHITLPPIRLPHIQLPKKTIVGLGIALGVIIVLIGSVLFMQSEQQAKHNDQVFHKYYDAAKQEYDSGNAITTVNSNATSAKDSFQKADDLLKKAKAELPINSPQAKQVNDLLSQVEGKLQQSANIQTVSVAPASESDSNLLATEKKQNAPYVSTDNKKVYYISPDGVFTSDATKPTLKNDSDWQQLGGFAVYNGNVYVLDKQKGLMKFVGGTDKTSYFAKDTSPNLSHAVSMAIDSSVYILSTDGSINKYTKGEPDTFAVKGIDKPLASPTRIFTTIDTQSVYILDNGNGRIVQLGKDGTFQKQYVADQLAKAKDIDVQEGSKKIYFLTADGLYSISL